MKANRFRFRAWDKDRKVMLLPSEDSAISFGGTPCSGYTDGSMIQVDKDDWVLMQSTGLLDANGTEIFEGDIVLADNAEFVVEYCQKTAGMLYRDITPTRERAFRFPYFTHYSLCEVSGVVVGNIYERGIA